MQTPIPPTPARAALTCLLAAAMALAATSHAAEHLPESRQAARVYQIESGPLASVLGQFAAAAGVALSYDPASTRQRQSGGLRGSYTVGAGFAAILAGSGLEAVEGGAGEFIVRKMAMPATAGAAAADATELPAVRVVARAAPAPVDADERYQPTPDASSLRTTAPMLEIPQVVNVVPAR
jgi:iron complex outermembrane receptor protein